MVYIPRRTYETAEIPEAITAETVQHIKPILKTPNPSSNKNEKKYMRVLLYALILIMIYKLLT